MTSSQRLSLHVVSFLPCSFSLCHSHDHSIGVGGWVINRLLVTVIYWFLAFHVVLWHFGGTRSFHKNVSTQTQPQEKVCYFFDLLKSSLPHQSNQEQNMLVQGNKRGKENQKKRKEGKEMEGETGKQRGREERNTHKKTLISKKK